MNDLVPSGLQVFSGISSRAFEHPADRAALAALRAIPVFDTVLRALVGLLPERSLRQLYLAGAVRIGPAQAARIFDLHRECCAVLDLDPPELFVAQSPLVNAGAIGAERPFIVLTSELVDQLDDGGLRYVLGHELGHILAGHAVYKMMAGILLRWSLSGTSLPGVALYGLIAALREWDRKSELTGDRAGLLCLQDPAQAVRVHMALAGGRAGDAPQAFLAQAREAEEGGGLLDAGVRLMQLLGRTHPFHTTRAFEVSQWAESGGYSEILAGRYAKRSDDVPSPVEDAGAAFRSYADSFKGAQDPIARFLREMGGNVTGAGKTAWSSVRDWLEK